MGVPCDCTCTCCNCCIVAPCSIWWQRQNRMRKWEKDTQWEKSSDSNNLTHECKRVGLVAQSRSFSVRAAVTNKQQKTLNGMFVNDKEAEVKCQKRVQNNNHGQVLENVCTSQWRLHQLQECRLWFHKCFWELATWEKNDRIGTTATTSDSESAAHGHAAA